MLIVMNLSVGLFILKSSILYMIIMTNKQEKYISAVTIIDIRHVANDKKVHCSNHEHHSHVKNIIRSVTQGFLFTNLSNRMLELYNPDHV